MNAYPDRRRELREIVDGELVFTTVRRYVRAALAINIVGEQEKTLGLVLQALERAPRWSIKRLTSTYLTLHLSDIASAVGIESVDEVRALIVDMVSKHGCLRISASVVD